MDIYDEEAVAKHRRVHAHHKSKPKQDKPTHNLILDDDSEVEKTIEELITDLKKARDYEEARLVKTKISGMKDAYALEVAQGRHVPVSTVRDDLARIGAAVGAALTRFDNDFPPMLVGLPEVKIQKKVKEGTYAIRQQLADKTSDLYTLGDE